MPNSCALSNLLPASAPATTQCVFLLTLPATFAPKASSMSLASSRLKVGKVPVSTKVWPAKGRLAPAVGSPSAHVTPQARSCSTTSRLWAWSKKVRRLCATVGPTSATCSSWSCVASMMASILPKWRASSLAVASPTWRMPRPNTEAWQRGLFGFFNAGQHVVGRLFGHALQG